MSKIFKTELVSSLPAVGQVDIIYIRRSDEQAFYWDASVEDYRPISYQDSTWILEDSQHGDYTGFSSFDLSDIASENPHEVLVTFEIAAGGSRNITLSAHFVVRSAAEETAMPSWYYDANYNGILALEFTWTSQLKRVRIITGWTQFKQGTSFTSNDAEMKVYYR